MRIVEPLLGTRAEVAADSGAPLEAAAVEQAIIAEVARLEAVFTVFDHSSELHALRRSGTTEVSELLEVTELAGRWRRRTDGAFHPGIQPLLDLWDTSAANDATPPPAELKQAAAMLQADHGVANLNLNAIAKGWIADRALQVALAERSKLSQVSGAWLSLGGDVVHRGTGSVVVGIEDPRRPYDNVAPLMTVTLTQEALATSGGARRWWTIEGQRYSKVLDPRTGQPVDRFMSATIIAPDGATADVLATLALVLDPDETRSLAAEANAAYLLIDQGGVLTSSSDRFKPSQTR